AQHRRALARELRKRHQRLLRVLRDAHVEPAEMPPLRRRPPPEDRHFAIDRVGERPRVHVVALPPEVRLRYLRQLRPRNGRRESGSDEEKGEGACHGRAPCGAIWGDLITETGTGSIPPVAARPRRGIMYMPCTWFDGDDDMPAMALKHKHLRLDQ